MEEEQHPRRKVVHEVGQLLDDVSVHELDERIVLLKDEIERLEQARLRKQQALTAAGSVFR